MIPSASLVNSSLLLINLISLTTVLASLVVHETSTAIRQGRESQAHFDQYRSDDRLRKRSANSVDSKKFFCHYDSKAASRSDKGKLTPDHLDPHLCTHIIYCCASLSSQHDIQVTDIGILLLLTNLKRVNNNNPKILISVSDGSTSFGEMISSQELRELFIRNSLRFLERNNLDGIELAWNQPKTSNQEVDLKKNFARLLSKFRKTLSPKNKLLLVSGPNEQKAVESIYDVAKVNKYVDFINLQTYDYNVYKDDETGVHSPLYASSKYDFDESDEELNVNWTVNYWLQAGASKEKLLLGIATSGRSLSLKKAARNQVDDPTSGPGQQGQYTRTLWLLGYFEICSIFNANPRDWNHVRVKDYEVPYAHKGNQWICYEDMESVKVKARYAVSMGLSGVSINSLDLDDFSGECHNQQYPLTKTAKAQLGTLTSSTEAYMNFNTESSTKGTTSTFSQTPSPVTQTPVIKILTDNGDPNRKPLICYYENLAATRPGAGSLEVRKIDPFVCTHLIYTYLGLADDKKLKSIDEEVDLEKDDGFNGLKDLAILKKANPRLKILIAIGGENQNVVPYFEMVGDPQHRATFIESVLRFLGEYKLDGLSIDFEWSTAPFEESFSAEMVRKNYVFLLRELKASFQPKGYQLMAAVSPDKEIIDNVYNVPQMSNYLDFINIRCFDYNRTKKAKTAIISPLFHSKLYDLSEKSARANANWTISYWIEKGAPVSKITLGIPLHANTYTLEQGAENEVNADAHQGPHATYTRLSSFWAYFEVCFNFRENKGWTLKRVSDYKAPYAYRRVDWVTYEDMESVKEKANYVNKVELAGVSVFSLDKDDFLGVCHKMKYPLTKTIKSVLAGQQVTPQVTPIPTEPPKTTKSPTKLPKSTTTAVSITPKPVPPVSIKPSKSPVTKPTPTPEPPVIIPPAPTSEDIPTVPPVDSPLPEDAPICGTDGKWWFEGSNCNEYYDCTSGTPNLFVCPVGQVWKQEKLWCDNPRNKPAVECEA